MANPTALVNGKEVPIEFDTDGMPFVTLDEEAVFNGWPIIYSPTTFTVADDLTFEFTWVEPDEADSKPTPLKPIADIENPESTGSESDD